MRVAMPRITRIEIANGLPIAKGTAEDFIKHLITVG
jgi:hypothetical protein